MTYQAPNLEELCLALDQIRQKYKEKKQISKTAENDTRLESITLIERLSKQIIATNNIKQVDTLIGLILFVQLKLENKYGSMSGWLPKERGVLNELLKSALSLSNKNDMTQQERLIYLSHFYDFAQINLQDEWVSDLHYQNKKQFLASIDIKLKQTVYAQRDYINFVLKESPDFVALENNIDKTIADYEREYNSRTLHYFSYFKNPEREAALALTKIVQASCKKWIVDVEKNQLDEKFLMIQKEYIYDVRRGLAMFVVMPIYKAHKRLSPNGTIFNHGSSLFKGLLGALNKQYDDFDHDERIRLLKAFLNHLEKGNIDFSAHKNINLKELCNTINHLIAEEELDKNTPTYKELYTSIAINYAAQYGIKLLVSHVTTGVVLPNVGGMIVGASIGPLGIVSYGVAGVLIETQLGQMVQEQIIDRATAMAYEYVLTAIGTYIGQIAAPNIMLTFEISANSLSKLLGFYQDLQQFNQGFERKDEWVKTLHQLPNHLISEKEKQVLEKTKSYC